jgi:L-lactate dehydrogenase complex protein LldE
MIRHGYLELFADDPSDLTRATQLAGRTFELSQFLWEVLRWAPPARPAADLVYHASCHLQRGLGVDEAPRRLLEQACGGPPAELEPECCGFGGIFAVEHAAISRAMLARRIGQIEASGAQRVVGGDVGCLMHLEGGLRRKGSPVHCAHLAQILDRGSGTLK